MAGSSSRGRASKLTLAVVVLAAAAAGLAWWEVTGRSPDFPPPDSSVRTFLETGSGKRSIVCIQPYMTPPDYATPERFERKLAGYLDQVRSRGWLRPGTVVAFPEYIGAWLVASGEPAGVYEAADKTAAMKQVVVRHLPSFVTAYRASHSSDRTTEAVFRMKARRMAGGYHRVFSSLAKRYGCTVIAGSTVLPSPAVRRGRLVAGSGPLYNCSVVYGPDGLALGQPVRKCYPTSEEVGFIGAGRPEELPVFDTPAGRIAVLICADAWFPDCYRAIRRQRPNAVIVPSFGAHSGGSTMIWDGYSAHHEPTDVDKADIGKLTEEQAWGKYAIEGRLASSGASVAARVPLRGKLWDMGTDGVIHLMHGGRSVRTPDGRGAAIACLRF